MRTQLSPDQLTSVSAFPSNAYCQLLTNCEWQKTIIKEHQCPSDQISGQVHSFEIIPHWDLTSTDHGNSSGKILAASSNYFASGGPAARTKLGYPTEACGLCKPALPGTPPPSPCPCYHDPSEPNQAAGSSVRACVGLFCMRRPGNRIKDVTDGTAKTLAIGEEILITRGDYGIGATGVANSTFYAWMNPSSLGFTFWGINQFNTSVYYYGQSFSSHHPGGANFAFGDGHVEFISEVINLQTFAALGTRSMDDTPGEY
jgi:prepilin-type processing-associated H-X9-DG protein